MELSLSAAAKATDKGKSTIHRAIKTGKLSARRTEDGAYLIDASELARVFPLNVMEQPGGTPRDTTEPPIEPYGTTLAVLQVKVSMLEDQLHRERETSQDTISDLRKRLDRAEDRILALSHQPASGKPQEGPSMASVVVEPVTLPRGLLRRLLGR